jgi:pyruvate/2-oxoglutarate/acetoin dehydrogenase E1 component/TPP-dependent pyruvate/acetoin dehydrogenase alpha subunit
LHKILSPHHVVTKPEQLKMTDNLELSVSLDTPLPTFENTDANQYRQEVLNDYELCVLSREISIIGRREVLTGKGKFGIFGDGKEVAQVALAKTFKKGDWRSGYYRDQTWMFASGISTPEQFFAQLYTDCENDPFSGGRQMNAHFSTANVDKHTGEWLTQKDNFNTGADVSCTAGQVGRAVGLALASKKYREIPELRHSTRFSDAGNEVCFCTIGDASTSEGPFFEMVNAAGVMRIPLAIFIWDDGYGISVPSKYQTTKGSISEVLRGFEINEDGEGLNIYTCKAWDYQDMVEQFERGIDLVRKTHIPAIFHVQEVTQPQGHSTSGSHERYKNKERLEWEHQMDCNNVLRQWILSNNVATETELQALEFRAKTRAREAKNKAWTAYSNPIKIVHSELINLYSHLIQSIKADDKTDTVNTLFTELKTMREPFLSEMLKNARKMAFTLRGDKSEPLSKLNDWINGHKKEGKHKFSSYLYSESPFSALKIPVVQPTYSDNSPLKNGYEIINAFFDKTFEKYPNTFAFGEDVGGIGDVNQGFMNLQNKYGVERVFDTGIREWTIMGQAIGMALRGLRPIAEIQYLDYLIYALAPLSDDLACLRYRTNGIQQSPCIIRSRGHRLEGIWHSGSPMSMIINSLRGIYVCVPRNFVQAAGMYNTLLQSDDPGLVIECLNGYRLKEKLPDNIGEMTVPFGVPEVLQEGNDVTLVTYGSCVRIAQEAIETLEKANVSVELIDIQTLLPFDLNHIIVQSLKKTNRIIFLDEDVPSGATAYMMQEVLEKQGGYKYLDCPPRTISAKEHRPPYGSDGDYFSKPNAEDVVEVVMEVLIS